MRLNLSVLAVVAIVGVIYALYEGERPGRREAMTDTTTSRPQAKPKEQSLFVGDMITGSNPKACKGDATTLCKYTDVAKAQAACRAVDECIGINVLTDKHGTANPTKTYFLASATPEACVVGSKDPQTYQTQCDNARKDLLPRLATTEPQTYESLVSAFGSSDAATCTSQCALASADGNGKQWCGGCYGAAATTLAAYGQSTGVGLDAIPKERPPAHAKQQAYEDKARQYIEKASAAGAKVEKKLFGWV